MAIPTGPAPTPLLIIDGEGHQARAIIYLQQNLKHWVVPLKFQLYYMINDWLIWIFRPVTFLPHPTRVFIGQSLSWLFAGYLPLVFGASARQIIVSNSNGKHSSTDNARAQLTLGKVHAER